MPREYGPSPEEMEMQNKKSAKMFIENSMGRSFERIKSGAIGKINNINEVKIGDLLCTLGGEVPIEIGLKVKKVDAKKNQVYVNAGDYGNHWIALDNLRDLHAITDNEDMELTLEEIAKNQDREA